jgi:hypothetical protein
MKNFIVEWLDWDYRTHKTVYRPKGQYCYDWSDKRQIRSSQRGKVRQILQRFQI